MGEVTQNYRQERIERLLHELRYEVERGMMEGDIDETLCFAFFVPLSKSIPKGVVRCVFQTRPIPHHLADPCDMASPKLRIVKDAHHD